MNNKVAKQLKYLARKEAELKGYPFEWAYKEMKKLWDATPKDKKRIVFK